jgi:hypothetical protein
MTRSFSLFQHFAGDRIHPQHPVDRVTEELDAGDGLLIGREHLQGVAPHPELAPHQVHLVAFVLDVHQTADRIAHRIVDAFDETQQLAFVLFGRSQAVDAGHRGDDDHVPTGDESGGGGVAETFDLVVDRRVLLDVGVGLRHVCLWLVVVVVGDEILHPVLREELAELIRQLGGQGLVGGDDDRRTLQLLDRPGDRRRLPRTGDTEQGLERLPAETEAARSSIAFGWSPAGAKSEWTLKAGTARLYGVGCDNRRR